MKIQKPVLGTITQGTIFNCAKADRYPNKQVHGLTITARCDVANDKYPVLNYLPIVTLFDWMHCDGIEILIANTIKSTHGNFRSLLKQVNIAESVLISVPRQAVVESFFDDKDAPKSLKNKSALAHELADKLDRLENLDIEKLEDRNWFLNTYIKGKENLVRDLINNKVASFYYLPSVTEENRNRGYVVLLRESAFLPRRIAKQVASGIDQPAINASDLEFHLSFGCETFAMPVGQIPSPNIEHILQTFSFMFGRIGLEDYNAEFISNVCGQTFIKEGTAQK